MVGPHSTLKKAYMIHHSLAAFLAVLAFSKKPRPCVNLTTMTKIPFTGIAELELEFHYSLGGEKAVWWLSPVVEVWVPHRTSYFYCITFHLPVRCTQLSCVCARLWASGNWATVSKIKWRYADMSFRKEKKKKQQPCLCRVRCLLRSAMKQTSGSLFWKCSKFMEDFAYLQGCPSNKEWARCFVVACLNKMTACSNHLAVFVRIKISTDYVRFR